MGQSKHLLLLLCAAAANSCYAILPSRIADISLGGDHTCMLLDEIRAVCFGSGNSGRLGTESVDNVGTGPDTGLDKGFVKLPQGRVAVAISAGDAHTCAIMDDSRAVCFGLGTSGRLGTESTEKVGDSESSDLTHGIVKLPAGRSALAISAGLEHTCAILDNNKAVCFGSGASGRLGTGSQVAVGDRPSAGLLNGIVQLPENRTVVSISAGGLHTCAILDTSDALCFGYGYLGRLGTNANTNVGDSPSRPLSGGIVQLPANRTAVAISAGYFHTCAVLDDGQAVCFGGGVFGRLGTESTVQVGDSPGNSVSEHGRVRLPDGRSVISISAGHSHTCAVLDNGEAVCFGRGQHGRLGTEAQLNVGDSAIRGLAHGIVKLPEGRTAVTIAAGEMHSCALLDNGQAVCFGRGSNGRLGTWSSRSVGDRTSAPLSNGIVKLPPPPPSASATPSPTPSVSPSASGTPSVSPSAAGTPSVSPSATATPSFSGSPSISPGINLRSSASGTDDDATQSFGAGPIAAVAVVGTVAVGAAAYTVQRARSTRRRRQARGVATKPKVEA